MVTTGFCRYLLRTTDTRAAAGFYEEVLGRVGDGIVELPEAAIVRGAKPHWLGHVAVGGPGEPETSAAWFVERGAARLGPLAGAGGVVVLRDPGGAVVALSPGGGASQAGVAWHQLNTREPERAARHYSTAFGWLLGERLDRGQP